MKYRALRPLRTLIIGTSLTLASLGTASAANYYLQSDQSSGWSWNTVGQSTGWYTAATGGTQVSAIDPDGIYYANGHLLRTPATSSNATFGGASLVLDNGSSLALKMTNSSALAIVGNLSTLGTTTITAADANHYHSLSVTQFTQAGTTNFTASTGRSFNLTFGTLTGSGTINLSGADTTCNYNLGITDASGFSGAIDLTGGSLTFSSSISSAGSLSLSSGSVVQLNQSITVSALSIGGTSLSAGIYSYATLNSAYDAYFADGSYTGSITVASAIPEPANAVMILAAIAGLFVACYRKRRA